MNFILLLGIIGAIALFVWAEQQRRQAIGRLEQTEQELEEIRQSTQQSGEDVAQRVLEQIRKHIDIPTDPQPTVATIIDVDRLRETNEFYNQAKNGDHLIITERRAILYDADRDLVLDVVPVRISNDQETQNQEQQQEGENQPTPSPEPGQENQQPGASPAQQAPQVSPGV